MFFYIAIAAVYALYKWLTKNDDFFLKKGIPYEKPLPIFGNLLGFVLQKESFVDVVQRNYVKYKKSKIFGLFCFMQADYMITDPELIKSITIRIMSPLFTSAKMKMMFGLLSNHASDFLIHFKRKTECDVDVYDIFSKFTADGIFTALLGFEGDCVKNGNSDIYKIVKSSMEVFSSFRNLIKFLLLNISPKLYAASGLQLINKNVIDFFRHVTIDAMHDREQNNISRPDMIQLLSEVRKAKGRVKRQEEEINEDELRNFAAHKEFNVCTSKDTTSLDMNNDDLWIAQTFVFFIAGFHTTSRLLQTLTYELAKNEDIQQELYEEIQEVLATLGGEPVTYEALHKMKFLDCVISEALRIYPPAVQIDRCSNEACELDLGNGKTLHIAKGQPLSVPIFNIHRDPDYFPDPEKFDPTRFNDENKSSIVAGSYLPFGMGARVCIGSRFALMESKLLIFNLLANYKIQPTSSTPMKLTFKADLSASVKETVYLKFVARA